jgi:hypothetical protein
MRSLAQPAVLKSATMAALLSAVVCYPRLSQWHESRYPLWYLESLLVLGGAVLWAFVFAWHTQYTHRPVFTLKVGPGVFAAATGLGIIVALALRWWVDPSLRAQAPEEYPANLQQWLAMTLFSLAFSQLFLVFAPLAWLLRLCRGKPMAVPLAALFGVFVMLVKYRAPAPALPSLLLAGWLALRLAQSLVSIYLFLRGGVLLVWWWCLLLQSRHLLRP